MLILIFCVLSLIFCEKILSAFIYSHQVNVWAFLEPLWCAWQLGFSFSVVSEILNTAIIERNASSIQNDGKAPISPLYIVNMGESGVRGGQKL